MKKLYTFGCSFTRYYWPTWAEMLGREYDHFENWGNSGLGNRAIVERLTECIVHNQISKEDTVVIQWSEFHRFDFHLPMPLLPEGWSQGGNLLAATSIPKDLLSLWNEKSYVMHSLNYINLAVRLLESIGCNWYMTSIRDLHRDASEFFEFNQYCKVFEHERFIPPISEFLSHYDFPKKELYDHRSKKVVVDEHPTPIAHYGWLAEVLAPLLKVNIDHAWCEHAQTVLMDDCKNIATVDEQYIKSLGWSREQHWVRGVIDCNYISKSLQ